jgi:hypothetical protein
LKHVDIRRAARLIAPLLVALSGPWLALPSRAQTYHNIVNQKFRTVADGPQSALIVDVPNPNDAVAVRQAAMAQYSASLATQSPAIKAEIAQMRQRHLIRPTQQFDFVQAAIVRTNGRLAIPVVPHTRGGGPPDTNDITFFFPTSGNGAWTVAKAAALTHLANDILKPELKLRILGPPLWRKADGTNPIVNVLNNDPTLGKGDEVIGALVVVNGFNVEIEFPSFNDSQTEFLAMAQAMAQAFHGPYRIGYDAWEQGMARAAAVIAAKDLVQAPDGTALDPTNGFYYTPYYDLLNQPPLGNNTFTPPTLANAAFSPTNLSGMLIPRLQMSSTAWLKCYIENSTFFTQFNAAYYDSVNTNVANANDINVLRNLVKGVLPTVEAQGFDIWYEQQFVLDTSVSPGPKIYADVSPTFPQDGTTHDGGAVAFLVYYNTTLTTSGQGDETNLSASVNPIYWDYTFANSLNLGFASNAIPITDGFGSVAPFFTNIGGNPVDQMRVAMDFPANREYVRVYFPTGQTGLPTAPTDFSGVFVGVDSGNLSIQFDGAATKTVTVAQGEFGGNGVPSNNFSRDVFTFTPTGSSITQTYQRNILHRSGTAAPVFKFVAPAPTVTLAAHTFQNGPQMISLPIKPLVSDMATVLGVDPKTLLLAQYRQDLNGVGGYQLYPSLPTYQPGYGLWSNLNLNLSASITGLPTDVEKDISVPLLFGWNQIGSPYTSDLNVTSADISFSYRGQPALSLADAIQAQWVGTGITAFTTAGGYVDITSTGETTVTQNTMHAWQGYWIRVTVTEGVTIIYSNPNNRSAQALKMSRAATTPPREIGAWSVPLALHDSNGNVSAAIFGQSNQGAETFTSKLDAASPPPFTRAATLAVRFPHPDWNTGTGVGGDFLSDIRHTGTKATWNVTVSVPKSQEPYTLTWPGAAKAPKGTRLTLVDTTNGSRTLMNTASSYSFTPAQNEVTRQFQIIAEPRSTSGLFIRNVAVDRPLTGPGRAATSAVIHYELSADAQTTVNIRLNGSIVRHLTASGRAASSGVNQIVWDLRDDKGIGMPGGPYTLEISAQTAEGERTRSILPVIITR